MLVPFRKFDNIEFEIPVLITNHFIEQHTSKIANQGMKKMKSGGSGPEPKRFYSKHAHYM